MFTVPETIPKGDRHTVVYWFLRSQKARDVPLDVALAGCHALNKTKCNPPIEQQELDTYLRRVWDQEDGSEFSSKDGSFGTAEKLLPAIRTTSTPFLNNSA